MSRWKALLAAARPRTLPLSLSGIISGSAIAQYLGVFDGLIFGLAIAVVLCLQILSNFSNDLGDSEKGTDNDSRIGPMRTVQSGAFTPEEMKFNIKILIGITLILGILLILVSRLLWMEKLFLLALGLFAIYAAHAYTRGKFSYGYKGLGDLSVFIFFGWVSVLGSLFLYIHHLSNAALLPATGVGCLSAAVLHLNNMRDRVPDNDHHKITIAVRLGKENSKIYFLLLLFIGTLSWISYVATQTSTNLFSYIYWLGLIPNIFILIRFLKIKEDKDYDTLLKPTALTTFFTSILFFISQVI